MARAVAKLLGRSEDRLFVKTIEDLEVATGHKSVDVKLIGDVLHQAHVAIKKLGLDSADSTALEVYNALRVAQKSGKLGKNTAAYVGIIVHERCISLNEKDLATDESLGAGFNDRTIGHMQKALLAELKRRYIEAAGAHNRVASRLLASL